MKVIDFSSIVKYINIYLKEYDNTEYTKVIEEYKKTLSTYYRYKNNENYTNTLNIIEEIIKNKDLYKPSIKNSLLSYRLKKFTKKNKKYNIIEELGEGFYGKVYKIEIDNKIYALKESLLVSKNNNGFIIHSSHFINIFINEIEKLKIINTIKPKIAPTYYDSWVYEGKGYILLEYINCGTLNEFTKKNTLTKKDNHKLKNLIKILHKYNLFHNDLHLDNILVECNKKREKKFYLNDFGLTQKKEDMDFIYNDIDTSTFTKKQYIQYNMEKNNIDDIVLYLAITKTLQKNKISCIIK